MATPTPVTVLEVNLVTVLTESQRIISAHSRHFLGLSLLFLLLPSFALSLLPSFLFFPPSSSTPHLHLPFPNSQFLSLPLPSASLSSPSPNLLYLSLFSLFLFTFSLLSTSSITHSVLHGFYGRPVKLLPAAVSAFASFFPLFVTSLLVEILLFGFLLLSGSSLFLLFKGIELLGLGEFELSSPYIMVPFAALAIAVVLVLIYLQLNWVLSSVVVVVESSWGLEPLKRSRFLIEGMRRVALSIFLFFRFFIGVLVGAASAASFFNNGDNGNWRSWVFVVQIVVTCALLMVLFLYKAAANTVLYMYCKAARGELAWEIAEEFARDYVSFPFDDEKVPHIVSVVFGT